MGRRGEVKTAIEVTTITGTITRIIRARVGVHQVAIIPRTRMASEDSSAHCRRMLSCLKGACLPLKTIRSERKS